MAIGRRVPPSDWEERTTGAGSFVADVRLDGMCTARILRSPHPHADVVRLDAAPALRVPGVVAVVTPEDFGPRTYIHHGGPLSDRRPLARRVRYIGEEVAAVAAETPEAAAAGIDAIAVSYRRRQVVLDVDAALTAGAPALHDRADGPNVALERVRRHGDTAALARADAVAVAGRYVFGRQGQAPMEASGTVAAWDPGEQLLHVWVSTQAPYFVRKELAHLLDLRREQVVTHEVAVGGGFGSKAKIGEHEVLAAMLSMKSGRPVRLVLSRAEEFAATKPRHEFRVDLRTLAEPGGRLLGREADVVVDNGAYNATGPSVMGTGISLLSSMYRTDAMTVRARLVDTNTPPGGSFRGYGVPQVTFAVESQMDELAGRLAIDPIELRLRNLHEAGDVTHSGFRIGSTRLRECLEAVRRELDWDRRRGDGGRGRGVGVAVAMHVSGANAYEGAHRSEAGVDVTAGGEVVVRFGGADTGTGQRSVLAQVVAEELAVPLERVSTLMMDSARTPFDMGSWSSRGTVMAAGAAREAARRAAAELRERAAGVLGVRADEVQLAGGRAGAGGRWTELGDLVAAGGPVSVLGEFDAGVEFADAATGVADLSSAYSFAAHGVALEVDGATGQVRIVDYVAAHDCGTAINPTAVEGQIVGGVAMGLGAALGEHLGYEGGRTVNPAYLYYPLPRAADMPPVRAIVVDSFDPRSPYGVKSVGEICVSPVAPAVANAIAHATGVRLRATPFTPDKLLAPRRAGARARTRRYELWRRPDRWWISAMRWAYPRGVHRALHALAARRPARRLSTAPVESLRRPDSVAGAVRDLAAPSSALLGGGTDLLPRRSQGLAAPRVLVDLGAVADLGHVDEREDGVVAIGAGVTLTELAARAPGLGLGVLAETIRTIASDQIRNVATVGGNLAQANRCWFFRNDFACYKRAGAAFPCYAVGGDHRMYHAVAGAHRCQAVTPSDLATSLLALDATAVVAGPEGERELALDELYRGPGELRLGRGELVRELRVPAPPRGRPAAFEKLALWTGDFAVVAVAVADHGDPAPRVVLGGVAPTPWRVPAVERALAAGTGTGTGADRLRRAARAWQREAHPLPGNEWKVEAASRMLERALGRMQ